ncbi:hypothetical protein SCL_0362 [Sulfuricaulis limicola]|uniref:Uncharacterized protein n=2 Tax=Sulfuricaulis limicola TaxID=1620215 RepID=A0A1B4XCX8_9GAMM|nr:hypothetical protein SCL_0362 [Sulfuricaulis limicola]
MKRVKVNQAVLAGAALILTAGPALSAPTGKLSWLNDTSFAGVGPVGAPEIRPLNSADYTSFGINLYSSRQGAVEEAYPEDARGIAPEANTVRLYGEVESSRSGTGSFASLEDSSPGRVNVFGVAWQHRLNAMNTFAVSAEYGEGAAVYPQSLDTLDTRAAFSWTSVLPSAVRPSVTGSVFLGDEMAREEIYRHLGRRYYGFTVGGSLTLFQSHTPYVSFRMQRSVYETSEDSLLVAPRTGDRSLLSAGWKWQAGRDLSLQAEASYGLGEASSSSLDPYSLERSRILFGTRFGFK